MNIVRQLTPDEYETWNEFVRRSPEGSLFQTIAWNQMLCETDPHLGGFLPLVSLDDKGIQAGIIVCYRNSSGKKISDLPLFGYVSPILSSALNYADRQHTYGNYLILTDLLKKLKEEIEYVRLENSPEIWDIRSYSFQSWNIETTYTHILKQTDLTEAWKRIDPEVQKAIDSAEQKFTFREDEKYEYLQRFVKLSGGGEVLQKRIDWLRSRGLCRLYVVADRTATMLGMTLTILSRENSTVYLWGSMCDGSKLENEVFPYLFWKSYEELADEFPCMDLGGSGKFSVGLIKDKLGCEPTPRFITTHGKKTI
jgi:hypothetical protein